MRKPKGCNNGRKFEYKVDKQVFEFACEAVLHDEMSQRAAAKHCGLPYHTFRRWIFRYYEPEIYGKLPDSVFYNNGLPRLGTEDGE